MSHGFAGLVTVFLGMDKDTLVGRLIDGVGATGVDLHRNAQIKAWREQIHILRCQLSDLAFSESFVVLEYELPRRFRRPDVVLLHEGIVFVIEFKVGAERHDAAARWQVRSYGMDLRDFHAASHDRVIVPIVCATRAECGTSTSDLPNITEPGVTEVFLATAEDLGSLVRAIRERVRCNVEPLDPDSWLNSPYRPTPTIIEAALRLYEGHGVREISHRYAHNLDRTTGVLVRVIDKARREHECVICFVTGIPGAGKTLMGLNVVHDPELRGSSTAAGIFLSGNGPLVKIVLRTRSASDAPDRQRTPPQRLRARGKHFHTKRASVLALPS